MFLSLGNLRAGPRTGLLFLDWTTGTTLQGRGDTGGAAPALGRTGVLTGRPRR